MKYEDVCDYAEWAELDLKIFENPSFNNSIIGISHDDRVIYDFDLMVEELVEKEDMTYEEAVEFIEYNTLRALSYEQNAPIVLVTKGYD